MTYPQISGAILFLVISGSLFSASHHPQTFLSQIAGKKDEGKQIVQHFCIHCHGKQPLIPLGAPRIGVSSDWKLRIKQSMDVLFKHTSEGLKAMPARGGCFECTDEQLMLSIIEMLPESLQAECRRQISPLKKQ